MKNERNEFMVILSLVVRSVFEDQNLYKNSPFCTVILLLAICSLFEDQNLKTKLSYLYSNAVTCCLEPI